MKRLIKAFINTVYNLYSFVAGLFYGRSRKNIVIGSWGGMTFSDNSRFLYQYLVQNKDSLGISNVIWVTRDEKLNTKLNRAGYKSCLIGTKESKKWHLKSKIHIICNMFDDSYSFKSDIDTRYSCGARKIQLWHGVGIKACGDLTNRAKKNGSLIRGFLKKHVAPLFSKGLWKKCYFVATSKENERIAIFDYGFKKKKIISGIYPRLCYKPSHFEDEEAIITDIGKKRDNGKVILYLPTFRDADVGYVSPDDIDGFDDWLEKNNYLWIQKSHSISRNQHLNRHGKNFVQLPDWFDINILYDYIDMVISDYSSASSDAVFKNLITLEYCPDYDYYKNDDRGFVADFLDYHVFKPVFDSNKLFYEVDSRFNTAAGSIEKRLQVKEFLFGKKQMSMREFSETIIGKKKKNLERKT